MSQPITPQQLDILDHTANRAAGGFYCGGGKDMDALVEAGLMVFAGTKPFVPDKYYRITEKGRQALKEQKEHEESKARMQKALTEGWVYFLGRDGIKKLE